MTERHHLVDIADNGSPAYYICINPYCKECEQEFIQAAKDCPGHEWHDDDPGDPEVGPAPDVFCIHCGVDPLTWKGMQG